MSTANQRVKVLETSIQLANQTFKEGETHLALKHIEEGLHIDEHNADLLETANTLYHRLNDNKKTVKYAQKGLQPPPPN